MNKGYGDAGASWHKKATKGFRAMSGSPKEDIDANNYTLRQRARMLYMAAPIATSAIRTNRTNVVGIGLQLKSRIDREALGMTQEAADAWQAQAEREFALWSENKRACDATGVNNFAAMQQLALSSWLVSGDVFAVVKQYEPTPLTPYSLRLHLIEADRVATPTTSGIITPMLLTTGKAANGNTIYDGVEVNSDGQIEAYHIRSTYPFELGSTTTTWARVQAYGERTGLPNILHVMESERPDQYRGVSYLAQVIEPLLQLRRYTESELTAAVVESFFTAFIKTEAGAGDNPFNEVGSSLPEVSRDPNEYEMGPGQINIMEPGEDVTFADPKRPASGFNTFLRAGYNMERYTPPFVAPRRVLTLDELRKRGFGEALYSQLTPEQRQQTLILRDADELGELITNREEAMAAETMLTNGCVMKHIADDVDKADEMEIRFYSEASNPATYTPTAKWDATGGKILKDLEAMIRMLTKRGLRASDLVCSPDVADTIINDAAVQKLLDNRRIEIGNVEPELLPDGAAIVARLNVLGRIISVISYDLTYTDDEGKDKLYIPSGKCVLTAPGAGRTAYGAVSQVEQSDGEFHTYAGRRVPKYVSSAEGNSRTLTISSRPLMIPNNKNPFIVADVLTD